MGFWDAISALSDEIEKQNKNAKIDAGQMSTEDLCYKVNTVNILFNPLIWKNCSEELTHRAERMKNDVLYSYYCDYADEDVQEAANIFKAELESRGLM